MCQKASPMWVPGPIGSPSLSVCENAMLVVDLLHFVCVNSFLFQAFFFSFGVVNIESFIYMNMYWGTQP